MIRCAEIAAALEERAPLQLQEGYDNCGWQVGDPARECTGVLVCVDATPERVDEAVAAGCNMVVSHHPSLFNGLKSITGLTMVEQTVLRAIDKGVGIYALHTALDNAPAPYGVSTVIAAKLGLRDVTPLDPHSGGGAIGVLPAPEEWERFVERVKQAMRSPIVRSSDPDKRPGRRSVSRVALCGGSGSSMIDLAIAAGADAYVTSDTSYHKFVDYAPRILLADIGHFEGEECTKSIIERIIREKFPNFAVQQSRETNPILYL